MTTWPLFLAVSYFTLLHLFLYCIAIEYDEGCYLDKPETIQMAFVMDQTDTFTFQDPKFHYQFAKVVPHLIEAINKKYPDSEFALTLHADWPREAMPEMSNPDKAHNNPEGCYTNWVQFTKDKDKLVEGIKSVEHMRNGFRENSLAALAFTAADNKLGWVRKPINPAGKSVKRVLVLVTDEEYGNITNPGSRHDFKGDGSDTCSTSKPPDIPNVGRVLLQHHMNVIALLKTSKSHPDIVDVYKGYFSEMNVNDVSYCGREFTWSYEDEKNIDIVNFITDCVEVLNQCVFGDPPAFNTLGL